MRSSTGIVVANPGRDSLMDFETKDSIAKAYEFVRMTHELAIVLTNSVEALRSVMSEGDPGFQAK
jgi:hypothetical protein